MQDIRQYEETQESLAMLKILTLGKKEAEEGKAQPMDEAFDEVRKTLKESVTLPPVTASLFGVLKKASVSEKDYRRRLKDKHL
jgi:ABC-type Fe2+-enterobactin transport system substrate-binding protein